MNGLYKVISKLSDSVAANFSLRGFYKDNKSLNE
jgi:hypothetical protein